MNTPDDQITDTTPVPLAQAIRLFFPLGGITKSSLRNEARKGRLVIERIANRDFVTRQAIDDMRRQCRIKCEPKLPLKPTAAPSPSAASEEESKAYAAAQALIKGESLSTQQRPSADITVFPRERRS